MGGVGNMAAPNLATITASLERSLQNCSLNDQDNISTSGGGGTAPSSGSQLNLSADTANPPLELNSHSSLPFHWEQCLDLETGEIYFINWRTGMKAEEDPRGTAAEYGGEYYSEDDRSSYDSEGSSSESSPSSSREQWSGNNLSYQERGEIEDSNNEGNNNSSNVLVVGGCKSCLMYYMVPKQLEICPKCCGQLLHFDRSGNRSS